MNDAIHAYILALMRQDNAALPELGQRYEGRTDIQSSIGPEVGKMLGFLVRTLHAQRVLELGTCLGYSTVWLAQAVKETGGRLTSVELSHALVEATRRSLQDAGLLSVVDLVEGDAVMVTHDLQGPFDLILQDSAKPLYPELLERCVQLLRTGGILAADDALFKPMGIPAKFTVPVHRYNELTAADSRLYTTILPIGDGLNLSLKLHD